MLHSLQNKYGYKLNVTKEEDVNQQTGTVTLELSYALLNLPQRKKLGKKVTDIKQEKLSFPANERHQK